MPGLKTFAVGLLNAASLAAASDVTQLKQDTFEPFVKEHDLVLAECEFLSPKRSFVYLENARECSLLLKQSSHLGVAIAKR